MGFRIVIAGESQCVYFAECCLVADFLSQNLPDFCYDRVEKPIIDWQSWLCQINLKNKWHHVNSPIVWKETLMPGSKPYYIGGASQFLDYCYSYYNFDSLYASDIYDDIVKNISQYKDKVAEENKKEEEEDKLWTPEKRNFTISITGVKDLLTMHIISGLLEMTLQDIAIERIYIYDQNCSEEFMTLLEKECSFIECINPGKIVKFVDRIGMALASTDLLIIMNHVPFEEKMSIGEWLHENNQIIDEMALMINASGSPYMHIVFPNLGPACYNATRLKSKITATENQIVVATSDLGLEIKAIASEFTNAHSRNMFCPPVWGFVGINHLVDIRTTVQKYYSFDPYSRFTKVKKSSLKIGSLSPELRTMEYLMYFDETLWQKVADAKKTYPKGYPWINKAVALLDLIKQWLFRESPDVVMNLGLPCNGTFDLHFDGIFSQPARLINKQWVPAKGYLLPLDRNLNLKYLVEMAKYVMTLNKTALPPVIPIVICVCKSKYSKKKFIGSSILKYK